GLKSVDKARFCGRIEPTNKRTVIIIIIGKVEGERTRFQVHWLPQFERESSSKTMSDEDDNE
ncbi:hypothetical protein RDWZM_004452, partial [Blomia tropicalis]